MADEQLKAPYPWAGGKSKVAKEVWAYFGNVQTYIEPFFGSGAVLLGRPYQGTGNYIEIINDLDCFVVNVWRSLQFAPDEVAKYADSPVIELELKARNDYLMAHPMRTKMLEDPAYYDAQAAGWWIWGACCWAIQGWCQDEVSRDHPLPELVTYGKGVHSVGQRQVLPIVFKTLQNRMRNVKVMNGDWKRVLMDSITGWGKKNSNQMPVGIFLDPPYDSGSITYSAGGNGVAQEVRQWALDHGMSKDHLIALCGYDGDYVMPKDWHVLKWKAGAGFARKENTKERIWFSPSCKPQGGSVKTVMDLFKSDVQ